MDHQPRLLGNLSKGLVFVVSAPAGTGKTTLVRLLTQEFACVEESVSCTTRAPRVGEVEGKDYHFLRQEEFQERIKAEDFLEYAEVFGKWYGTSKELVYQKVRQGKHVVLVIDTQGAQKLMAQSFEAVYIFIKPPSLEELQQRLIQRKTEDEKTREERLSWAQREMQAASAYDYQIVNAELEVAYEVLRSIIIAEEHKVQRSIT